MIYQNRPQRSYVSCTLIKLSRCLMRLLSAGLILFVRTEALNMCLRITSNFSTVTFPEYYYNSFPNAILFETISVFL